MVRRLVLNISEDYYKDVSYDRSVEREGEREEKEENCDEEGIVEARDDVLV